jgi:hypothetical protein
VATLRTAREWLRELLERLGGLKWVMLALLIIGAGLVTGGAFQDRYAASVLLEIGAALFLVVPFIFLERLTGSRITAFREATEESIQKVKSEVVGVRKDVQRAQMRIDNLGEATIAQIDEDRKAEAEEIEALLDDLSEENVWRALHRAQENGAIDHWGVRVALSDGVRVLFRPLPEGDDGERAICLALEDTSGEQLRNSRSVRWSPEDSAAQALARLGKYRPSGSFDAQSVFRRLVETLKVVLASERGGLGPAVELFDDWVITAKGLEHLDGQRTVSRERLTESPVLEREVLVGGDPALQRDGTFAQAFDTAVAFHTGEDQREADRKGWIQPQRQGCR